MRFVRARAPPRNRARHRGRAGPGRARTVPCVNDDSHQWGRTGEVITGEPRVHGRAHLGTNGRGIQYAQPQ